MKKHIKTSICAALLTAVVSTSSFADCSYELFSISSAKNTKIIDFIDQLSDECGFSIVVTDPYAEKFLETKLNKTNLKNLTIDEVLNIILNENNLSYTLENNLLKISYLTTKVYNIDYILSQRKSTGSTDITLSSSSGTQNTSGSSSSGTTTTAIGPDGQPIAGSSTTSATSDTGIKIESTDEVKFWDQLDEEFVKVLNSPSDKYEASHPIINKNAGLITVTATNKQMKRFENYLKRLQEKVQLQVLIDVQLLAVTMKEGKTTGIDWKQLYALQNVELGVHYLDNNNVTKWDSTDGTNIDVTETAIAAGGANGAAHLMSVKAGGTLKEVIKFLKTQGDVTSISNPKVLTLNNQPALITAGTEFFYKIKSATNQQGTGGGVAATTQSDTVQSVFAGVLLTITPEIANDNTITLKINPSLSETTQDITGTSNTGRDMPPDLTRRQLSSVVTVKDGNRIILGGLINTKNSVDSNKVPLLGDIPVLNYLFKYEEDVKEVQELVIIIEPHIIHKDKANLSLSDLGYEGLSNDLLTAPRNQIDKATTKVKETSSNDDK
ncbi:pilus (MSHA type) biogenesis protein MshL [Sulfurimonas sp. C5]|uniref:pilus (MSHA type) biogenesis protein MshL n=1 Tax=Sulfurimonas sp. C5 TaxID=3036947 RepID=UPI002454D784|nr:pilus (MSHA type) biogenesis protein MshL [Sulfurimonas sp. C5]MDH4943547.1 pilus (MSHA type) biogenesis protein MshL [Sulfurimonas sp. C5]